MIPWNTGWIKIEPYGTIAAIRWRIGVALILRRCHGVGIHAVPLPLAIDVLATPSANDIRQMQGEMTRSAVRFISDRFRSRNPPLGAEPASEPKARHIGWHDVRYRRLRRYGTQLHPCPIRFGQTDHSHCGTSTNGNAGQGRPRQNSAMSAYGNCYSLEAVGKVRQGRSSQQLGRAARRRTA